MGARWYAPGTGVFVSRDPSTTAGALDPGQPVHLRGGGPDDQRGPGRVRAPVDERPMPADPDLRRWRRRGLRRRRARGQSPSAGSARCSRHRAAAAARATAAAVAAPGPGPAAGPVPARGPGPAAPQQVAARRAACHRPHEPPPRRGPPLLPARRQPHGPARSPNGRGGPRPGGAAQPPTEPVGRDPAALHRLRRPATGVVVADRAGRAGRRVPQRRGRPGEGVQRAVPAGVGCHRPGRTGTCRRRPNRSARRRPATPAGRRRSSPARTPAGDPWWRSASRPTGPYGPTAAVWSTRPFRYRTSGPAPRCRQDPRGVGVDAHTVRDVLMILFNRLARSRTAGAAKSLACRLVITSSEMCRRIVDRTVSAMATGLVIAFCAAFAGSLRSAGSRLHRPRRQLARPSRAPTVAWESS